MVLHDSPEEIAIHRWIVAASGIGQERVRWSDDGQPWPKAADGPWISLRMLGGDPGRAWVEHHRRLFALAPLAVSSIAGNQLTVAGHPLKDGDGPLRVVGATLPAGLSAAVDYWAIREGASALSLAATFENAIDRIAISLGDVGALPLSLETTAQTLRAGAELTEVTREAGVIELGVQCRGGDAFGLLRDARLKAHAPRRRAILHGANVGLLEIGGVQNVGAALNAATYEPRASMTARLSLSSFESDTGTVIDAVEFEETVT